MRGYWSRSLIFAAALATHAAALPAHADEIADFYKGRTVNIVVGSAPGGGYDTYARIVGRHIGRHIPGNPNVIVQNMPGAGQSLAANYVYSAAAKDGTMIASTSPGALLAPLLGGPKVAYDPTRFNAIGSANEEVYACYARPDASIKSFADAFERDWILGVSSGSTRDMPSALLHILGARLKLITGYRNSKDVLLAMERGEVHGICGVGYASIVVQNPELLAQGRLKVIVQASATGHPELNRQGVPLAVAFARTPEQRQALELVFSQGIFGRPFVVAPEVPAARVAALRKAFMATMTDPDLIAEADKVKLDIGPISGAAVEVALRAAFATPQPVIAMARHALDPDATSHAAKQR